MGAIVDEFLERLGSGERPDVEEYARRYPELASTLRQMLPALLAVHSASADPRRGAFLAGASAAIEPEGALGDFRIVGEVGRGGMGVVYEAVQISLGRRVALKVLPFAAALDARQLARFKNEAQAAAHLHHQHIVPVYGVGVERGLHYYAMQFIEGHTLAALIGELRQLAGMESESRPVAAPPAGHSQPAPSADTFRQLAADLSTARTQSGNSLFFQAVARLGLQAGEALEHAHGLGVVHRDVKPANLLIDGQGKLWVTDFGLARVQSDTRLTFTGDLLGTLRYMSPEQALAQPIGVDHRTDLYSLGATLYELLTLQPAFSGPDRQQLLRQIAFEDPLPPRRVNKAVPAELETIVLKAMAKNPEERYASAQELADDLARFLKDEPIRARRPTLVQRWRKWARRHRPVVWSATISLLVALAVLAGCVGWILRDRGARRVRLAVELEAALEKAQQSREEGKWAQALAAAKRAEALLEDGTAEPSLAQRVRALLRELAEEEADGRLVARLDEIRLLQAEVKDDRFVFENALPRYRQAFRNYGWQHDALTPEEAASRLRRRPASVRGIVVATLDHWLILARHKKAPEVGWLERLLALGDSDAWRGRVRAARATGDRETLEKLAREVDAASQPAEELFLLHMSLRQRGAREGALALLKRAQEAFPGDFWINHDLGKALVDCQPPRYEEAIRFLTAAVALRPESAGAHINLGHALLGNKRPAEACRAFRQAIRRKPDYATAYFDLGIALLRLRKLDEALVAARRATELNPRHAEAHFNLGFVLIQKGRLDEAIASYRRVVALKPGDAQGQCNLGLALRETGEFAQALAALKRGHELGSRRTDWRWPSARWVQACQRDHDLNLRLPAVLQGKVHPASAVEWNAYARICHMRRLYAASARLRAEAFRADPKLADGSRTTHRYFAACAAALAAAGHGKDAGKLSDRERSRLRKQALAWLRADLAALAKALQSGKPEDRRRVQGLLRHHWQGDPALAGLRDSAAQARMPADDREACKQFWAEVQALLARTD
jgi:serine/threonine protein kinase/Flp pilus assembly protein TadD